MCEELLVVAPGVVAEAARRSRRRERRATRGASARGRTAAAAAFAAAGPQARPAEGVFREAPARALYGALKGHGGVPPAAWRRAEAPTPPRAPVVLPRRRVRPCGGAERAAAAARALGEAECGVAGFAGVTPTGPVTVVATATAMTMGWERPSWPLFLERAHELSRGALLRLRPAPADACAARALLARAGIAPGSATSVALTGGGGCVGRAALPESYAALLRLLLVVLTPG